MEKNLYANSLEIQVNFLDAKLLFSLRGISDDAEDTEVCSLIVSPQYLKIIGELVNDSVRTYEKNFGEIKIPQNKDEGVSE